MGTGESYAGKYVPACAYTIHERNAALPAGDAQRINLKGVSIGDGAMDPSGQFVGFGDLLWYAGMVDEAERGVFKQYEAKFSAALKEDPPDHLAAFAHFDEMLNGDRYPYPTYYASVTGMKTNYFNYEQSPDGSSLTQNHFIDWLGS